MTTARHKIWGWYFFDWSTQPFYTLILAFVFAPYFTEIVGDGVEAQRLWGTAVTVSGLLIAFSAPVIGALAARPGQVMPWMIGFSLAYVIGHAGLWLAVPEGMTVALVLGFFVLAFAASELSTVVTNGMMPDLGPTDEMGEMSGNGWAFGYAGGLVALVLFLCIFLESGDTGRTLIGMDPGFGLLDPASREGARAVGPFNALWYALFMIPFFLWVRPARATGPIPSVKATLTRLRASVLDLPRTPSLFAYLGSSMFYRDALNGLYFFCGIYASGVLGWSVTFTGLFGILAIISGTLACLAFGRYDSRLGPKPVIIASVMVLLLSSILIIGIDRTTIFGLDVTSSRDTEAFTFWPTIALFVCGILIGGAGGVLQSSSRVMMVRQADPQQVTEGFGLYAMSGRATSFLAPFLITLATGITDSQRLGMLPLLGLFLIGLFLLYFVNPAGHPAHADQEEGSEFETAAS